MRYKMIISYDGRDFKGFQVQTNARTVQRELNKAAKIVTGVETDICASGRTDSGVHAKAQVIHFDADLDISGIDMMNAFNANLPKDIYVRKCVRVADDFHARYSSVSKTYVYVINTAEYNPILRDYVLQHCHKLDVEKMQKAIDYLVGEHDFSSFATGNGEEEVDCVRTIFSASVVEKGNEVSIRVTGSGFLRHMVRCIVGTMIDVGRGKLEVEEVKNILEKRDRGLAGRNVLACGLYLVDVKY